MTTTDDILRLEKARTQAILDGDVDALQKMFSDDLVYIHATGRMDTKASFIETLAADKSRYKSFTSNNVKVRIYGDCAIVSGEVLIQTTRQLDLLFTNVWVKDAAGWRNVHWHTVSRTQ